MQSHESEAPAIARWQHRYGIYRPHVESDFQDGDCAVFFYFLYVSIVFAALLVIIKVLRYLMNVVSYKLYGLYVACSSG